MGAPPRCTDWKTTVCLGGGTSPRTLKIQLGTSKADSDKLTKRMDRLERALDKERRKNFRSEEKLQVLQQKAEQKGGRAFQREMTNRGKSAGSIRSDVPQLTRRLRANRYPASGGAIVTGPLAVAAFGAG